MGIVKPKLSARWRHIEERLADESVQQAVAAGNEAGAALYILGVNETIVPYSHSDLELLLARRGVPANGPGLVVGGTSHFPISILGIDCGVIPGGSRVQLLVNDLDRGAYNVTRANPLPRTLGEIPGQVSSPTRVYWTSYTILRSEWTPDEKKILEELTRQAQSYVDPHRRRERF